MPRWTKAKANVYCRDDKHYGSKYEDVEVRFSEERVDYDGGDFTDETRAFIGRTADGRVMSIYIPGVYRG